MTIALVSGQFGGATFDSVAATSFVFPGNVSLGSLIVVSVHGYKTNNTPPVAGDCTKTAGTATLSAFQLDKTQWDSANSQGTAIWSAIVTGTGSLTVGVATGGGDYIVDGAAEFSGSWDASRSEDSNGANFGANDSPTSGNATSAGAALFIGTIAVYYSDTRTITENNSFNNIYKEADGSSHGCGAMAYRIVSTGSTLPSSWTLVNSNASSPAVVVYKEAAGGGGASTQHSDTGAPRNRPGRGPFSKGKFALSCYQYDQSIPIVVPVVWSSDYVSDIGQTRNRPGRGPYSFGRFSLSQNYAFTESVAVLSAAIAEVATAIEAWTASVSGSDILPETAAASDSMGAVVVGASSLAETGALLDVLSSVATLLALLTDSNTAVDLVTNGSSFNVSASESGSGSDALTSVLNAVAAFSEAANAADVLSTVISAIAPLIESGATADALSTIAAFAVALAESVTATDALSTSGQSYSVSLTEAGSGTDTTSSLAILLAAGSESGAAADVPTGNIVTGQSLTESVTSSDSVSVGGQSYSISITESGNLSDLYMSAVTALSTITDSGNAGDAVGALALLSAALTQAGNALDALTAAGSTTLLIVESGSAQDAVLYLANYMDVSKARLISIPYRSRVIAVARADRNFTIN